MERIRIGATSFLDYVMSTPRGCTKIVKAQRSMYSDPDNQGFFAYESIKAAMKRAVNATDPTAVLAAVTVKTTKLMVPHYGAIASGFLGWLTKVKGTGIRTTDAAWTSDNLTVTLRHVIGLQLSKGQKLAVLAYVKEPVLTQDSADLLLRIMEVQMANLLPGAVPVVLDTRRAKLFKLRANANRSDLDALLAAEAAKYVTHWTTAA